MISIKFYKNQNRTFWYFPNFEMIFFSSVDTFIWVVNKFSHITKNLIAGEMFDIESFMTVHSFAKFIFPF